jgi:hypothetical protein
MSGEQHLLTEGAVGRIVGRRFAVAAVGPVAVRFGQPNLLVAMVQRKIGIRASPPADMNVSLRYERLKDEGQQDKDHKGGPPQWHRLPYPKLVLKGLSPHPVSPC